ncbi:unnamed protein product [Clonostachys solani]|uniref:Uncharacterized protein n=1 Tax=Clonostachys solani TaxID=160281 RepID=A0A9N9YW09_9HYPO|nr:unnamed protein product [Clonostachys solani]
MSTDKRLVLETLMPQLITRIFMSDERIERDICVNKPLYTPQEEADSSNRDVLSNNIIEKGSLFMRGSILEENPAGEPQNQGIQTPIAVIAKNNTVRDGSILVVGPLSSSDLMTVMKTWSEVQQLRNR